MVNINDKCKIFYLYKYIVANKSYLNVYSVLSSSIKSINSK